MLDDQMLEEAGMEEDGVYAEVGRDGVGGVVDGYGEAEGGCLCLWRHRGPRTRSSSRGRLTS
jgi:hypothetical protein